MVMQVQLVIPCMAIALLLLPWPASSPYGVAVVPTFLVENATGKPSIEEHAMASNCGVSITTWGQFKLQEYAPKAPGCGHCII